MATPCRTSMKKTKQVSTVGMKTFQAITGVSSLLARDPSPPTHKKSLTRKVGGKDDRGHELVHVLGAAVVLLVDLLQAPPPVGQVGQQRHDPRRRRERRPVRGQDVHSRVEHPLLVDSVIRGTLNGQ
jgi:hypothetical protein